MNRDEMLKELQTIDLRAIPTVATMDMGLQYDYATSEGAGTGFGGMGDWPAYMFNPIEKEQWLTIRKAIKENTLAVSDLKGTGLDKVLEGSGSVSIEEALEKVHQEYRKYQVETISPVEDAYMKSVSELTRTMKDKK